MLSGELETLSQRVHYMSGRENMTLVDGVSGRDVDNMRTRDMFALSNVARRWVETRWVRMN
jgi:hypothetical protein